MRSNVSLAALLAVILHLFLTVPVFMEASSGPQNVEAAVLLPYVSTPVPVDTRGYLDTVIRIIAPSTGALFKVSIYDREGLTPPPGMVAPVDPDRRLGLVWEHPARSDPPDELRPWQVLEFRIRHDVNIAGLFGCLVVQSSEPLTIYFQTESIFANPLRR